MTPTTEAANLKPLADALRRRLAVIGDHALRDSDPAAQLAQLQAASEEITRLHEELGPQLPPQIAHFMESQSYLKALRVLEAQGL